MLPAAFVFCFGGKFVFGGISFACTAGFFPRFGGSSVARPGGAGGVQVNDALVAGAAEPQRNIVLCGDEFAVHQHIDQAQHLVRHFAAGVAGLQKFGFVYIAGVAPDGFVGVQHPYFVQERHQRTLVFRLKGFAAQKGKPINIIRGKAAQNFIAHGFIKG